MSAALQPGDVTALILAGGAGTRMGGCDKGLALLDGRPLIEHVVQRVRPQAGALVISANRNLDRYRRYASRVVTDTVLPDAAPGAAPIYDGPLAGMLAGLRAIGDTRWLLCAPCDTPFLPLDLAARLHAGLGDASIAVATTRDEADDERVHPLCALLRGSALAALADDLARYMADGGRRVRSWQQRHNAVTVAFGERRSFYNANDRDALDRAAHRLASPGPGPD
ncbi:molybdenum cofactor guanylyltransferase MobA [Chitinasiproducens palmae]|uniref:Molybdenum cofactor guanylyltransferase n=1 Tax=Chitinasiproducens palmae TaxID=1770053 RepID=A0A1H2PUR1_9BURK|nr:molybdenum cofactor guanylyltransferase MobA [Chitinasiproducens palmae]SDV50967.1 molybdenum cofactor guanylyltransferase [Chitinasiproducens palmae]